MARSLITMPRMFVALTALAIGALGTGCTTEVSGGGDGGSGGGGGTGGNVPVTTEACTNEGASQGCNPDGDPNGANQGNQTCVKNESGKLVWNKCEYSAASTPLVLSFDGAPVTFQASARAFAINGTMSVATDWPTARTPWLALDRNRNGSIDDGGELFGSATLLKSGERATNGFLALRELDTDGDGQLTSADAGWSQLRLWNDGDSDRVSSATELTGLGARRLVSIDLAYAVEKRCDDRGNCEVERAGFRYVDESGVERSGVVIDVHLAHK
ncbi:MAG: calcium-binding protein [Byssovorax sp.]